MCDYSLQNVASRPAKIGDQLVTTKFADSISHGFTEPGMSNVAVCLMPGTEIAFEKEAQIRHPFAFLFPRLQVGNLGSTVARFRHVNLDQPQTHHDALEFANGRIVLLTQLRPGQRATVLQLPPSAPAPDGVPERKRLLPIS